MRDEIIKRILALTDEQVIVLLRQMREWEETNEQ